MHADKLDCYDVHPPTMTKTTALAFAAALAFAGMRRFETIIPRVNAQATAAARSAFEANSSGLDGLSDATVAYAYTAARRNDDLAAMAAFRPGYSFWQHIFTIPDGSIAFGSAVDGRLLAVFPTRGDWSREAEWHDPALAGILAGQLLARDLDDRRDQVAALLEQAAGPVVHNPTRGRFLLPNARRYGSFLKEWGAIYERFGVPAEIGLAQAIIESGLNPTRRSAARAVGFCQWLAGNWKRLNRLAPDVIEGHNQTTQAPYCAAYLTVLATKYGSFIPALSEHHSGGTNVGRILINGGRLGGEDARSRYFLGSQMSRDLRRISLYGYREIYRTYGPRSYFYSEMVLGNTFNVSALTTSTPQEQIFAMQAPRAIPLAEITRRTRLSVDEVQRFNPALLKQVPARATLYLPFHVREFGRDVSFWHGPPSPAFASALNDFVRLDATLEQWDDRSFEPVLRAFQKRFSDTNTEEGTVMATVLAYVIDETYASLRGAILADFRGSEDIRRLFERAILDRDAARVARAAAPPPAESDPAQ
jgi:hypothetical protein